MVNKNSCLWCSSQDGLDKLKHTPTLENISARNWDTSQFDFFAPGISCQRSDIAEITVKWKGGWNTTKIVFFVPGIRPAERQMSH